MTANLQGVHDQDVVVLGVEIEYQRVRRVSYKCSNTFTDH